MSDGPDEIILKADPSARKRAVLILLVFSAFALAAIYFTYAFIDANRELISKEPKAALENFRSFINIFFIINYVLVFSLAGYLLYYSKKIISSESNPPPAVKVFRDTRLSTGRKARMIGFFGVACACVFIISAFVMHWFMLSLVKSLTGD